MVQSNANANENQIKVQTDAYIRYVQAGYSHEEANMHVRELDIDGRDCYLMVNDLGIEYRWTNKKVGFTTEQFED